MNLFINIDSDPFSRQIFLMKMSDLLIISVPLFYTACCPTLGFPLPDSDSELVVVKTIAVQEVSLRSSRTFNPNDFMYVEVSSEDACGDIHKKKTSPNYTLQNSGNDIVEITTKNHGQFFEFYGESAGIDTLLLTASWWEEGAADDIEETKSFDIIVHVNN